MKNFLVIFFVCCLMQLQAQSEVITLMHADSLKNEFQFSTPYLLLHPEWEMKNLPASQSKHAPSYMFGYKTTHLPGFFCKMEYKIEQKSKLSPRFRLGSLNYTEWMEGKGEFYMRYAH